MTDFLSAGVFPSEVNFSAIAQNASTSVFGLVGVFQKGPVGVPTVVTSLSDAVTKFGTYLDASGYYGMIALKAFFDNGGGRAYVVRTTHYVSSVAQGAAATATLSDRNGTPASTLTVSASSFGIWGDALSVTVSPSTAYPSTGFNIAVLLSGVVQETFKDLLIGTANVASADHVEKRINGSSLFITVTDLVSATSAPANRPAEATTALTTGNDGLASITAADFIGDSGTRNGLYAFDTIAVNFIAIPGEADSSIAGTLAVGLITYVQSRGDCVALVEAPQGTSVAGLVAFRTGASPWTHASFDTTFAALAGPGGFATHPITGRDVWVPPAGVVAGLLANNDNVGAVWTAAAGATRGVISGLLRGEYLLSKGDRDTLGQVGINPICLINGGLRLNGQKTLALKLSKLSDLNVRRTMCYLEVTIDNALDGLLFEPDNPKTWDAAIRLVNPVLRAIQDGGGLNDFKVICDASINTPAVTALDQMKVVVYVQPTGTVTYIPVQFSITPDGTDFSEL